MRFNKKVLALACATLPVVAAPSLASAQTQVKLYGLYDGFVGGYKTNAGTKAVVDGGGMSTSYWGVGGSEDLGGGLKAVFAAEAFVRNDTGQSGRFDGDSFFARNSYVGLAGGWGQATVGRNTTPYFLSTIIFNPFGDSFVFSPMVLNTFIGPGNSQVQGDTGQSNSVRYTSPSFGGVTVDVLHSRGAENAVDPRKAGRSSEGSVTYFGGPLALTAVVRKIYLDPSAAVSQDQTSWQLGATYDFGIFKLYAQYQQMKMNFGSATVVDTVSGKTKDAQIGGLVKVGNGNILASYVRTWYSGTETAALGDKQNSAAVGYDYFLSTRTDLYAMYYYSKASPSTALNNQSIGFGIRHRF